MQIGPGTRIRHATLQELGTVGCVLRPLDLADPRRFILSAAHVLNPGGYGAQRDVIEANDAIAGWQPVAELVDWTPINSLAAEGIEIDAAIAELHPQFAQWQAVAQAVAPTGLATYCYPGMDLKVYGAETALLTSATLHSSGGEILVDYRVEKSGLPFFAMKVAQQIFYGREMGGWSAVTQGGDSGALVTDQFGLAVGLHIGSTNAKLGLNVSVCTPMQRILDRFGLTLDLGTAPAPGPALIALPTGDKLSTAAVDSMNIRILPLLAPHNFNDGVKWQLTPRGVMVVDRLPRTGGQPLTVAKVWRDFGVGICQAARVNQVAVELIIATICTESHGDPLARRVEPDGRMSVGLMQTLIGTAQAVMRDTSIDATWLESPQNSIDAGTACIANERRRSGFDPPLVAAIYNAGSLRKAFDNPWGFAQYVGTHTHADSFVEWFNDCFAFFDATPPNLASGEPSFWKLLKV